jgi:hypothetical protein
VIHCKSTLIVLKGQFFQKLFFKSFGKIGKSRTSIILQNFKTGFFSSIITFRSAVFCSGFAAPSFRQCFHLCNLNPDQGGQMSFVKKSPKVLPNTFFCQN